MKSILRPHQTGALDALRAAIREGDRRPLLRLPTGSGKTMIAVAITEGALARGHRVGMIVPSRAILGQAIAAFEREGIGPVGIVAGGIEPDPDAPVQIISAQALPRRACPDATLIIIDEAHLRFEAVKRLMEARPDAFFVGLSATPFTAGIRERFGRIVTPEGGSVRKLTAAGYLVPVKAFAPVSANLSGMRTRAGDFAARDLDKAAKQAALTGDIIATWLERAQARPTLAFAVNVRHANDLMGRFMAAGINAAIVTGETDEAARAAILASFMAGDIKVIVSVAALLVGFDCPHASCLLIARPTKSPSLHFQMAGRILRPAAGKSDALLLDHAANLVRLGLPVDADHVDTRPGQTAVQRHRQRQVCPHCSAIIPAGKRCQCLPHEPPEMALPKERKGQLVAIDPEAIAEARRRDEFLSGMLAIASERGFRPGWACHRYRDVYGQFPPRNRPLPPAATPSGEALIAFKRWRGGTSPRRHGARQQPP